MAFQDSFRPCHETEIASFSDRQLLSHLFHSEFAYYVLLIMFERRNSRDFAAFSALDPAIAFLGIRYRVQHEASTSIVYPPALANRTDGGETHAKRSL